MIKKYKKLNILSRGVLNWMVHTKCTPIEETLLRVFSPALVSPYMPSKSDKTAHNVHGKNAFKDRVFLKSTSDEESWWYLIDPCFFLLSKRIRLNIIILQPPSASLSIVMLAGLQPVFAGKRLL